MSAPFVTHPPPRDPTATSTTTATTASPPLTPTPLPALASPSPPTPTSASSSATSSQHPALVSSAAVRIISQRDGIVLDPRDPKPPTPAPSPQPRSRAGTAESSELARLAILGRANDSSGWTTSAGRGEDDELDPDGFALDATIDYDLLVLTLRAQINLLPPAHRQLLLTNLIADSAPASLSPLVHLITPRLKRDFLKTLPLELAFHVLSFVDDVKTLARASGVSRFWRALLEDEATWKRMCWKSGFGNAPKPPPGSTVDSTDSTEYDNDSTSSRASIDSSSSTSGSSEPSLYTLTSRMRTLEFGPPGAVDPDDPDADRYTPAGRERRGTLDRRALSEFAARAELFDLPVGERRRRREGVGAVEGEVGANAVREPARARSWSDATRSGVAPPPSTSDVGRAGPMTTQTGLGFTSSLVSDVVAATSSARTGATEGERIVGGRTARPRDLHLARFGSLPVSTSRSGQSNAVDAVPFASAVPTSTRRSASDSTSVGELVSPPMVALPHDATAEEPSATGSMSGRNSSRPSDLSVASSISSSGPPVAGASSTPKPRMASASASTSNMSRKAPVNPFSYKTHFKRAYLTESAWLRGPGRLLSTQMSADDGVVTSLGFDEDWIVVGMATSKVHVFEAGTGRYVRTLDGHELGVWCLTLVGKSPPPPQVDEPVQDENERKEKEPALWEQIYGSEEANPSSRVRDGEAFSRHARSTTSVPPPPAASSSSSPLRCSKGRSWRRQRRSSFPTTSSHPDTFASFDSSFSSEAEGTGGMGLGAGGATANSAQQSVACSTARGWGQGGSVVVSGGCDREVRVWDIETGKCLHTLRGHTSTVRCMRVLDGRPIAVSGSRDATLRVWDLKKGECIHLLNGHEHSVRCIEVSGNRAVSGSYDATCRLWDVDTGECLHVFRGHIHQIYAVAFDGIRVVTGSLDSTVRIWSAETGEFLALLQGHTSLVGQLVLVPGSPTPPPSSTASSPSPLGASSSHISTSTLQTSTPPTLVTGGSDGRVIVFDLSTFETVHRLCAHDNSVTCLQVDSRFIVTGGNDGRIKLWDFRTGALIRELAEPCGAVWRVVFRDDKCVTLCRRDGKTLMDVRTFRPSEEELYGGE
ncbi:hypothetical protein JCM10212_006480 [Sporobolomyces blumeae]